MKVYNLIFPKVVDNIIYKHHRDKFIKIITKKSNKTGQVPISYFAILIIFRNSNYKHVFINYYIKTCIRTRNDFITNKKQFDFILHLAHITFCNKINFEKNFIALIDLTHIEDYQKCIETHLKENPIEAVKTINEYLYYFQYDFFMSKQLVPTNYGYLDKVLNELYKCEIDNHSYSSYIYFKKPFKVYIPIDLFHLYKNLFTKYNNEPIFTSVYENDTLAYCLITFNPSKTVPTESVIHFSDEEKIINIFISKHNCVNNFIVKYIRVKLLNKKPKNTHFPKSPQTRIDLFRLIIQASLVCQIQSKEFHIYQIYNTVLKILEKLPKEHSLHKFLPTNKSKTFKLARTVQSVITKIELSGWVKTSFRTNKKKNTNILVVTKIYKFVHHKENLDLLFTAITDIKNIRKIHIDNKHCFDSKWLFRPKSKRDWSLYQPIIYPLYLNKKYYRYLKEYCFPSLIHWWLHPLKEIINITPTSSEEFEYQYQKDWFCKIKSWRNGRKELYTKWFIDTRGRIYCSIAPTFITGNSIFRNLFTLRRINNIRNNDINFYKNYTLEWFNKNHAKANNYDEIIFLINSYNLIEHKWKEGENHKIYWYLLNIKLNGFLTISQVDAKSSAFQIVGGLLKNKNILSKVGLSKGNIDIYTYVANSIIKDLKENNTKLYNKIIINPLITTRSLFKRVIITYIYGLTPFSASHYFRDRRYKTLSLKECGILTNLTFEFLEEGEIRKLGKFKEYFGTLILYSKNSKFTIPDDFVVNLETPKFYKIKIRKITLYGKKEYLSGHFISTELDHYRIQNKAFVNLIHRIDAYILRQIIINIKFPFVANHDRIIVDAHNREKVIDIATEVYSKVFNQNLLENIIETIIPDKNHIDVFNTYKNNLLSLVENEFINPDKTSFFS